MKRSLAAALALAVVFRPQAAPGQEAQIPNSTDEIVHVLNRVTFGPRPGDIEKVQAMGLQAYLQQQLHPETIDDSAVEQEVSQYKMLSMSDQQLMSMFADERRNMKQRAQAGDNNDAGANPNNNGGGPMMTAQGQPAPPDGGPGGPGGQRGPGFGRGFFMMGNGGPAGILATMQSKYPTVDGIAELSNAKLIRAVDSPRQLQEVLVDFWTNHFNVDMKKGPCRVLKIADDRDVIRPGVLGRFRDLLEADAKSPAMLYYLDNASNSIPHTPRMRFGGFFGGAGLADPNRKPDANGQIGGINENYAREIMELHTLGVDGGYTQKDVQEVARCFTGWTINPMEGSFIFNERAHDEGEKVVLGHVIPAGGGMKDGEMVLDILCSQPACAHFIAKELCQRFVADDPPPALVDRIAGVFTATDGDLRQVTQAILTSPEFLSPSDFNSKIKSPLEFAVSAIRASGATFTPDLSVWGQLRGKAEGAAVMGREEATDRIASEAKQSLNWHVYTLGEPLFACTPPTGYKENSKTWVNAGALIERLNFAMALTEQNVADVKFNPQTVLGGTDLDQPQSVMDRCIDLLLHNNITDGTRKVLNSVAMPSGESQNVHYQKLIALILGSPEFQKK